MASSTRGGADEIKKIEAQRSLGPESAKGRRGGHAPQSRVQGAAPPAYIKGERERRGRHGGGNGREEARREEVEKRGRREGMGNTSKIFENQQIPQKSILRRWYTQIPFSHPHSNNKKPKIMLEMAWGPR